jgi:hypothetical protein
MGKIIDEKILSKLSGDDLTERRVLNTISDDYLTPAGIRKSVLTISVKEKAMEIGKRN